MGKGKPTFYRTRQPEGGVAAARATAPLRHLQGWRAGTRWAHAPRTGGDAWGLSSWTLKCRCWLPPPSPSTCTCLRVALKRVCRGADRAAPLLRSFSTGKGLSGPDSVCGRCKRPSGALLMPRTYLAAAPPFTHRLSNPPCLARRWTTRGPPSMPSRCAFWPARPLPALPPIFMS